jgi:hypothetical protein
LDTLQRLGTFPSDNPVLAQGFGKQLQRQALGPDFDLDMNPIPGLGKV